MKRKYQILPLTSFLAAIFLLFLTSYAPAQDSPFTTLLRSETQRLERIIKNFESIDQALFDNDLFFRDAPGGKVTTVKKSSIEWVLSQDSSMHAEYKTTDQKWRQQLITRELPALLTDFRQVSLELRRNIRRNNYPASDTDISLVSQLRNKLKYFYIRKSVRQNPLTVSSSLNLENALTEYLQPGSTGDMAGFYQKSDESIRFQSANSGNANLQPPNNNSVNNTNLSPPTTEANPSGGNDSNLITGTWETKGYYGDIIRINIGYDRRMGGYRAVVLKGTSSLPKGKVLWEKIRYLKKENAWEEFDPSMDYHFKGRHSNIQNVSASDLEVKIRITHDYPNGDANKPYKESMVVLGKENVGFTGGYYKRIKTQGDFQPTNPNSHLLNNKEAVTQVLNQLLSTGRKGNFKEAKRYCTGKAALSMDKAIKWKSENFYEYSVASGVASAIKVGLQKISFKNNGASADVYLNIQVPRVAKPYVTNINGVRMKIVSDRWKISEFF